MSSRNDRRPLVSVPDAAPRALVALAHHSDRRTTENALSLAGFTVRATDDLTTLAALLDGREPDRSPFTAMPSFWSDQYHHKLQSFGMPGIANRIEVVDGSVDDACILEYSDDSGLVGVVGVDRTSALAPYRKRLMERG